MQGYRTLLANGAAGLGLPEIMAALHGLFPTVITDSNQLHIGALLMAGMNIFLRFKTSTPVGQAKPAVLFAEPQVRFLLALIRREISKSKESSK